jgi:hypothetical protein
MDGNADQITFRVAHRAGERRRKSADVSREQQSRDLMWQ